MRLRGSARVPIPAWCRVLVCASLLVSFFAIESHGQDLAEAARQEKARKAAAQKSPQHVYTEEDLKRQVILIPEDQAKVEARKRNVAPTQQNAKELPNDSTPLTESLGEIARRYRQEKAAQATESTAQKKFTSFPYRIPDDVLAEPKFEMAPLSGTVLGAEFNGRIKPSVPNLDTEIHPHVGSLAKRVSPFQPRPRSEAPSAPPMAIVIPGTPARPTSEMPSAETAAPVVPTPTLSNDGKRRVEAQRGQSWWKLAEIYLGNGARWHELRRLNAGAAGPPELLRLGTMVLVPEAVRPSEPSAPQIVKVRKGDTLWALAHEHLGRGSAWSCLAVANPQVLDYTHLAIGTSLQLPEGESLRLCRHRNEDPGTVPK